MEDLLDFKCPENFEGVNDTELKMDKTQVENLNREYGAPLGIMKRYLIVPQLNTAAKYTVNGEKVVSRRFWAIELNGNEPSKTARTIGISSIRGMHVGDEKTIDSAILTDGFATHKNDDGLLRADVDHYFRASDDTDFIKGDETTMRAKVVKPVVVTVLSRGGVYTLEYDNKTRDVKTNSKGRAIPALNDRFYRFKVEDFDNAAVVTKVTNGLKKSRGDFYSL